MTEPKKPQSTNPLNSDSLRSPSEDLLTRRSPQASVMDFAKFVRSETRDKVFAIFKQRWDKSEECRIDFIPGKNNAEGNYIIETPATTEHERVKFAVNLGFTLDASRECQFYDLNSWTMPVAVMEKVVPGAGQLTEKQLTMKIQEIPQHQHSVARFTKDEPPKIMVLVKSGTSRDTFLKDKTSITLKNETGLRRFIVSEKFMHEQLGEALRKAVTRPR